MLTFTNEDIRGVLDKKYSSVKDEIRSIDFLPFSNLEGSVKDDVDFLANHPLVHEESLITGWVYEVETGKVCHLFEVIDECFSRSNRRFNKSSRSRRLHRSFGFGTVFYLRQILCTKYIM